MQKRPWTKKTEGSNMYCRRVLLSIVLFASVVFPAFSQEKGYPVPTGNTHQLFYLQRTPNTNTVVYELNYRNGVLDLENPVHEFWLRYQEKGERKELSYIQRKFAYGIKARKLQNNRYELSIVSYKKYKMYLEPGPDKKLFVYSNINQKKVILTSIFLRINGGTFWSPNVEFIDLAGIEPTSRAVVKERLKL
jgi:hypothetical protein